MTYDILHVSMCRDQSTYGEVGECGRERGKVLHVWELRTADEMKTRKHALMGTHD